MRVAELTKFPEHDSFSHDFDFLNIKLCETIKKIFLENCSGEQFIIISQLILNAESENIPSGDHIDESPMFSSKEQTAKTK